MKLKLGEKRESSMGGMVTSWARDVTLEDGRVFQVSHFRGNRRIRIAYKPRGPGMYGWHWFARVKGEGVDIEVGRVSKSLGCKGILREAGLIEGETKQATERPRFIPQEFQH